MVIQILIPQFESTDVPEVRWCFRSDQAIYGMFVFQEVHQCILQCTARVHISCRIGEQYSGQEASACYTCLHQRLVECESEHKLTHWMEPIGRG